MLKTLESVIILPRTFYSFLKRTATPDLDGLNVVSHFIGVNRIAASGLKSLRFNISIDNKFGSSLSRA